MNRKQLKEDLYRVLTEALSNPLNEGMKKRKTPIFTIVATNIEAEESLDDMKYAKTYYSQVEAINDARDYAYELRDDPDLICVSVYAGEYETPMGDTFGEPYDIFTISNKLKAETMAIRKACGYVSLEVDEYAE